MKQKSTMDLKGGGKIYERKKPNYNLGGLNGLL